MSIEHPQLPLGLSLRNSARFENFYPGSNREAVAALTTVAAGSGEQLVYLAGQTGTGKSHLLQAVCHAAGNHGLTAAYMPLAEMQALAPEILDGLETMSLVCIDEVDAVAGHVAWETALFNLFNQARAAGNSLVFAGSRPPSECGFSIADLVSRLGWGLTYRLKALDDTELKAALEMRAAGRGLELPDDTARYLLNRISRDLPSVFELFDRLDEASMIEKRRLTIPFVKSVLMEH